MEERVYIQCNIEYRMNQRHIYDFKIVAIVSWYVRTLS
jgi:hypothetical protein